MESTLRPTFLLIAGRAAAFAGAFLLPLVLVRVFDQAEFGTYRQLFLVYATLYGIAQLGMAESLFFFLPRASSKGGRYVANSLLALAVGGSACVLLLAAAAPAISRWMSNPRLAPLLPAMGVYLLMTLASCGLEIAMISRKRYSTAALSYAGSELARVAFYIVPVLLMPHLGSLLLGAVFFAALRLCAALRYFRREFGGEFRVDGGVLRSQWAYALPFELAVVVEIIQANLHQYAVSYHFDAATFAIYSVGCLQIPLVDMVATSAANLMMVKMGEEVARGETRAAVATWQDTTRKLAFVFFPLVALLVVAAPGIVTLLYTEAYRASVPVFMIWSAAFAVAAFPVDAVLRVFARTRFLLGLNALRLLLVAALIHPALSNFRLAGAVLVTVMALALGKALALVRIAGLFGVGLGALLPWWRLAATAVAALGAALPAWMVTDRDGDATVMALLATGVVYTTSYLALTLCLGVLDPDERSRLARWGRGWMALSRPSRSALLLAGTLSLLGTTAPLMAHVTDASTYAPAGYSAFVPPGRGETYMDPAFATTVKRISDARATPNSAGEGNLVRITHEYATVSPFNHDNSLLILAHQSYYALYDGSGDYLRDLPFEMTEPRWSRHDPEVIYYLSGNQLKQYDVGTRAASTVRSFGQYSTVTGKGESDICFDGDHFVLVGDDRHVFVFEIGGGAAGPALDTEGRVIDSVQITPDHNVIVTWIEPGEGRFNGIELYDWNMGFLRQLDTQGGHGDVTRDTNGEELLVTTADPTGGCHGTIVKIRLADGQRTCLLLLDWSLAVHVSAPDGNGWAVVSTYAPGDPSPVQGWTGFTNEIFEVKLDGSAVRRLAQHRSRPFNAYTWTPRAAVSRDGSRVVYSSNYGLPAFLGHPLEYSDVYLVDLSSTEPSNSGSVNSAARRIEQDDPLTSYSGAWPAHPNAMHSGGSARQSMEPGARATLDFEGTGVSWIGHRDEWAGMANVYVDGELKGTVDTFASPGQAQAVLFSIRGLPLGSHTLVIEVSGGHNPHSDGNWIWIDAFDVTRRFEQDDPSISSQGDWQTSTLPVHSRNSASFSMDPAARVTFAFDGEVVSWIGYRDEWSGIARVYVDGNLRAEIDTYAAPGDSVAQALIYTISGLPPGPHTLTIEPTQRGGPLALGVWVWIDGFETPP
jgi:O-antigen/teichoic acid export membrane protein